MLDALLNPSNWAAFLTLSALEIVLGIDNIIFISILVGRLPAHMRDSVRRFGIFFALFTRILLLFSLAWIVGLVEPLFTLANYPVSGRDLILFGGGAFLLYKASKEIYVEIMITNHTNPSQDDFKQTNTTGASTSRLFWGTTLQIAVLDIVFSLDSVITAVGLVNELTIMVAAVVVAMMVMLFAAKPIGDFIHEHPSLKILALAFLVIVGAVLVAEAFGLHVPKAYIYSAMGFSLTVELLNIFAETKKKQQLGQDAQKAPQAKKPI